MDRKKTNLFLSMLLTLAIHFHSLAGDGRSCTISSSRRGRAAQEFHHQDRGWAFAEEEEESTC